jgi:hypothetical protein
MSLLFPIEILPLFSLLGRGFSALRDIEHLTAAIQKAHDLRRAHNLGWITSLARSVGSDRTFSHQRIYQHHF